MKRLRLGIKWRLWGQRSCVNSCSLSLISCSAVHYFPSGSNEAHEFCVWTWSPFGAQLWPPRPLGSRHKQIRSRSSCTTSVSVCFHLKLFIDEKCPNNATQISCWIPYNSLWMSGALTLAEGLLLTFISDFSMEQTRQPSEWHSFISPILLQTLQRTNRGCLRGKGCVCLTRWSFLGFLYALKWPTGGAGQLSPAAAFTRIFWFHSSEQEIFWFYESYGPETSLEAQRGPTENMKTHFLHFFGWKPHAARCRPLAARVEMRHFKIPDEIHTKCSINLKLKYTSR